MALGGCRAGRPTPADSLRQENAALRERVALLEAEGSELRSKLLQQAQAQGLSPEVTEATPTVAGIEIDSLSGVLALEPASVVRKIAVYIKPFDGRRRFTQAVGDLTVEVRDAGSGRLIATRSLSPREVREAYRSQFSGTYYVVEFSVGANEVGPPRTLEMKIAFVDRTTGRTHEAIRTVAVN